MPAARPELANGHVDAGQQQLVKERFQARAENWDELYQRDDLFSVIHRLRHDRALNWIDALDLPPAARVLEVGPGAGRMTVALAQRGLRVASADSTPRMTEITRRRAGAVGVRNEISPLLADVHRLPFGDRTFRLVVSLGVLPWLAHPDIAIDQLARVLQPGGYLVLSADNAKRLNRLLDPRYYPILDPVRRAAKTALCAAGLRSPDGQRAAVTAHRGAELDDLVTARDLQIVRWCTFGFGPFTLLGMPIVRQASAVGVHSALQRRADRGMPVLRATGDQYLVLARRRSHARRRSQVRQRS
jgi:ubiquinone/menaquinone biosynthesis C-methylase UbiE